MYRMMMTRTATSSFYIAYPITSLAASAARGHVCGLRSSDAPACGRLVRSARAVAYRGSKTGGTHIIWNRAASTPETLVRKRIHQSSQRSAPLR
jgi:hypothetical protein